MLECKLCGEVFNKSFTNVSNFINMHGRYYHIKDTTPLYSIVLSNLCGPLITISPEPART